MRLGVIGYGTRIRNMIDEIIRIEPACRVTAIADIRNEAIRDELAGSGAEQRRKTRSDEIAYFDTPEDMIRGAQLDGILIGTRCSLHAEMAVRALPSGIPLFLEKPVATNAADLLRLKEAYEQSRSEVVVSFPLRETPHVRLAKEIIDSGRIGTVEHMQVENNVPYGHVYFQYWYRDEQETGGLFLQKATHDFDCINHLLGIQPKWISAMTSKQIFKGDKPAGLRCKACDEQLTCQDSVVLRRKKGDDEHGEYCAYAVDTGNEDSGSALIQYETGMHAAYSQNFFARKKAATRRYRLLGYKGTLEFDIYSNQIKVFMHHTHRVETYDIEPGPGGHSGGDTALAVNFIEVMQGKKKSIFPLRDGLLSALMCLNAKWSAENRRFQAVDWNELGRAAVHAL
ncbi:Gfo/Idh/MocA family protein [Paenibacillus contaminans]|uniref:Gfo/Idh/MocA family oxidoreductase n=1 Tax=Paenibacillus contaminans TaxID=450362 RepID=A0A329MPD5_9BACL|nr:Gfo/Idh/MocA family oxidoreductase [Paenibacillus contaminans]RAV21400.1 gfo/Idh/MocA family oxidoreductase [Paenibacillus contaminans]